MNNISPILAFLLLMLALMSPAVVMVAIALFGNGRSRGAPVLRAFPVVDGPGTFHVFGVEQESQSDWNPFIKAESAANAQVKAELKGIVVTEVRRVR